MHRLERILVPLDFSPLADAIQAWAARLARDHGASLLLLHAVHMPADLARVEGVILPADFSGRIQEEARKALGDRVAALQREGITAEARVREGHPTEVILEEAGRLPADLIVIGTKGLSGLKHLFLGSVAEKVVQSAPCAVLTVKAPAEA